MVLPFLVKALIVVYCLLALELLVEFLQVNQRLFVFGHVLLAYRFHLLNLCQLILIIHLQVVHVVHQLLLSLVLYGGLRVFLKLIVFLLLLERTDLVQFLDIILVELDKLAFLLGLDRRTHYLCGSWLGL